MTLTVPDDVADALVGLRDNVVAPVAYPGEPDYLRCNPWNLTGLITPGAVVFAATGQDIAQTVRYAAQHKLAVTVQATGHESGGGEPRCIPVP